MAGLRGPVDRIFPVWIPACGYDEASERLEIPNAIALDARRIGGRTQDRAYAVATYRPSRSPISCSTRTTLQVHPECRASVEAAAETQRRLSRNVAPSTIELRRPVGLSRKLERVRPRQAT